MADGTYIYKCCNSINMISSSKLMKTENRLNTDRQKVFSRNKM